MGFYGNDKRGRRFCWHLPFWCIEVAVDEGRATRFIIDAYLYSPEARFFGYFLVALDKNVTRHSSRSGGRKIFFLKLLMEIIFPSPTPSPSGEGFIDCFADSQ